MESNGNMIKNLDKQITNVLFCGSDFPSSHEYSREYLQNYPFIKVTSYYGIYISICSTFVSFSNATYFVFFSHMLRLEGLRKNKGFIWQKICISSHCIWFVLFSLSCYFLREIYEFMVLISIFCLTSVLSSIANFTF